MNVNNTDNAVVMPSVTTGSEVVTAPTAGTSDVDSIMRKMADQQSTIANLSKQLQTKSDDVTKLSQKQRDEMMHVYQTVIKGWVDAQESVDPQTRSEFNNGIERLAENADDNGIWYVNKPIHPKRTNPKHTNHKRTNPELTNPQLTNPKHKNTNFPIRLFGSHKRQPLILERC